MTDPSEYPAIRKFLKRFSSAKLFGLMQEHMRDCAVQSDACGTCDLLSSAIDQAREDGR